MSVTIRTITESDLTIADNIASSAFKDATRLAEIERYFMLQPDGWFFALLDGKPVGFGGVVLFERFAYIGLMSVLPGLQRRGIGDALLSHLLDWIKQHDCPTALLDASEMGFGLYERNGFSVDDRAFVMLRNATTTLLPLSLPLQYSSSVSLLQEDDIPEVAAFDAPYFGASRAEVFSAYLKDYPERAFVIREESGAISGYIFAQDRILGPWVAANAEVAEMLLLQALSLEFSDEGAAVLAPVANRAALDLLDNYGFRQLRALTHMHLGEPATYRDRTHMYGQASFAIG